MTSLRQFYGYVKSYSHRKRLSETLPNLEERIKDYLEDLGRSEIKLAKYVVKLENDKVDITETSLEDPDQLWFEF
mgnify:CR=1 FL=1